MDASYYDTMIQAEKDRHSRTVAYHRKQIADDNVRHQRAMESLRHLKQMAQKNKKKHN